MLCFIINSYIYAYVTGRNPKRATRHSCIIIIIIVVVSMISVVITHNNVIISSSTNCISISIIVSNTSRNLSTP